MPVPPPKYAPAAKIFLIVSIVAALAACSFSIKKCAEMSVFLCENRNNSLAAGCEAPSR